MRYRTLGNTDMRVSEIGFGCGGTAGLMIQGSFEEQVETVTRAIELGINYFDEAPDYGDGVSETNLGKVLKEIGVRPFITTKVEVRRENLDDIAGHVERSVDASLRRLDVDYVDVIQIHNGPTIERPDIQGRDYRVLGIQDYLAPNGALEGLERVKRAGKCRYIGFICRGNDAVPVKRLIDTGVFSLINIVYTLLNPTAVRPLDRGAVVDVDWGQIIPYAHEKGVGVAVYSPLAGGVLTDHALSGGEPHRLANAGRGGGMSEVRRRSLAHASKLKFLSKGKERPLSQAATRFVLMQEGVTTVLGGYSDQGQLEEGVAASGSTELSEEELSRLEMIWKANFGD